MTGPLYTSVYRPWHSQGGMSHAMLYTYRVWLTASSHSATNPHCGARSQGQTQQSDSSGSLIR